MTNLTVVITGCNRGLGLEMARQYAADGDRVYAVVRGEPSDELKAIKPTPTFLKCDMSDFSSIPQLKKALAGVPIDILINNAGVYPKCHNATELTDDDQKLFLDAMIINVLSPLRLAGVLAENVRQSSLKKMVFITSKMGSISDNTSGGHYGYRASKAALNMVCTSLKAELPDITVIIQHPGWVKTDMGGPNGLIDVTTSVSGMRKIAATETRSGIFIDYKGEEIPW